MTPAFSGSGPGAQTRDGCSVQLYRVLPYMGELADIEDELRRYDSVLELGCGTGRLCTRLLQFGLAVSGVDESAEMLANMPVGVRRIQSPIEDLNLQQTWDAVLLPSHMINHPDAKTRSALVRAGRRHVKPGAGTFYLRRHDPKWLESVQDGPLGEAFGVSMSAENVTMQDDIVSMTLRYKVDEDQWTQTFSAAVLSEAQVEDLLRQEGFAGTRWLGRNRLWAAAAPVDA